MGCRKPSKATWEIVSLPKDCGGHGALNLYAQNESLILKHLHKFFNKADVPWVHLIWNCHYPNGGLPGTNNKGSFWWRDTLKTLISFKGMASVMVSDGSSCFFWLDTWNGRLLSLQFPELFSFVKNSRLSVQSVFDEEDLSDLFHLPLSEEAFIQYQQLSSIMDDIDLQHGDDTWGYIWGSNTFTSSKACRQLTGTRHIHPAHRWLWKSQC